MQSDLSSSEIASFLAGKAIAASTAFLDGRSDAAALARASEQLSGELLMLSRESACNELADPTRMLVLVMMRGARAAGEYVPYWRLVMLDLVSLLRKVKSDLHKTEGALP